LLLLDKLLLHGLDKLLLHGLDKLLLETSVNNGGSSSVRDGSDDTSVKTKTSVQTKTSVDTVETETSVDTVDTETSVKLGPYGEDTPEDAGIFHHV